MKAVWVLGIIFVIISGFWVAPTYADYHYASHDGSNEYPYTSWATGAHVIQDAVDAASPRDTVYIGAGDYNEHIEIPESTTHLGFIGMGWDSTYIYLETGFAHLMDTADSMFVSGIHFENLIGLSLMPWWHASLHVTDCYFTGHVGIIGMDYDLTVENCIFLGLDGAVSNWPGVDANVIVRNCLMETENNSTQVLLSGNNVEVYNNICTQEMSAFFARGGSIDTLILTNNISYNSHSAFRFSVPQDSSVFNNNISYNDGNPSTPYNPAMWVWNPRNIRMFNNSITNDNICIRFQDVQPSDLIDLRYNNFISGIQDIVVSPDYDVVDTSIIYHDYPMFAGETDFHLQAFSPLIDAGHPNIFDVDGTRSDIGTYGGPRGEVYTYIDLPPAMPDSIVGELFSDSIVINWRYNAEADFNLYYLHRDTISGFEPTIFNLIAAPETSYLVDVNIIPYQNYYYKIAALDTQDNISEYSEELAIIQTEIWGDVDLEKPKLTSITSNYPNPFNSNTTIIYQVGNFGPVPARINIDIYDVLGRKVRALSNERKEIGRHEVVWDGKDDNGDGLQSGVYFVRISQWNTPVLTETKKIMLLK